MTQPSGGKLKASAANGTPPLTSKIAMSQLFTPASMPVAVAAPPPPPPQLEASRPSEELQTEINALENEVREYDKAHFLTRC